MKVQAFDWLSVMVALGVLVLAVAAAMRVVRIVADIHKEARAARARPWWL